MKDMLFLAVQLGLCAATWGLIVMCGRLTPPSAVVRPGEGEQA